jgi:hypothetical protein
LLRVVTQQVTVREKNSGQRGNATRGRPCAPR